MDFDETEIQRLKKAAKAAEKTCRKKSRRAQRSLDERGPDNADTKALAEAARLASEQADKLRRELEAAECGRSHCGGDRGDCSSSSQSVPDGVNGNDSKGPLASPALSPASPYPAETHPSPKGGEEGGQRFRCVDRKTGVDLAEGLVLHRDVITPEEERELIEFVEEQCERGRRGELRKPTYLRASGDRSRGNSREAVMYGGFFDFNRARPGRRDLVPPFPPILCRLVRRLVDERGVLPADVRPDSVIINRYSEGDCIPPHVDHQSYYRPISTLSLLGEEPMLIGSRFKTVKACKWEAVAGLSVQCPRRSLLVLGGNSGNVAKHCISACSGPRISITLRKQPPPDWKPDVSELVSGGKSWEKAGKNSKQHIVCNDGEGAERRRRKSKPLSGSAKRRKKMAKMRGKEKD